MIKKNVKLSEDCEKAFDSNFDHKFYRNYLDNLEKSITFKNDCISQNTDKDAQNSNYDESIYDCYKLGIINGKLNMIESQNSKIFFFSTKKLALLKLRTINKNKLKKLGLTPLNVAEIYMEYNNYDKAVEYVRQIFDNDYFDYKVDMLQYMEKYEDALEVIISDKNKAN